MILSVYQGNDKFFKFTRFDSEKNIINSIPQNIWFTVKKTYDAEESAISKQMGVGILQQTDGSWVIHLLPEDTETLKPGDYVCDVKIVNEEGKEITIVKPQKFVIMDVATQRRNQG